MLGRDISWSCRLDSFSHQFVPVTHIVPVTRIKENPTRTL